MHLYYYIPLNLPPQRGNSGAVIDNKFKMLALWKISYHQPRQHIKKQRHYFTNKGLSS